MALEQYDFRGFPRACPRFLADLARHNDREWFAAHKDEYQREIVAPAQAFVVAMGGRLRRVVPDLRFDPRAGGSGSIFRIYRDTRFTKDKRPYKTHLGIIFWTGEERMGPGFYFHLEPPRLRLYTGKYVFDKEQLQAWRAAVDDPREGRAIAVLLRKARAAGYEVGGANYKRVPAGFAADHPRADLLRHDSVWIGSDDRIPAALYLPLLLDWCLRRFRDMSPLIRWLNRNCCGP
jgi:uncharacterized protein (TIGR02453 family)